MVIAFARRSSSLSISPGSSYLKPLPVPSVYIFVAGLERVKFMMTPDAPP
jgi:hypothetical protein